MNVPALLEFIQSEVLTVHAALDAAGVPRHDEDTDEPLSLAQRVEQLTGLYLARNAATQAIAKACASSASPK